MNRAVVVKQPVIGRDPAIAKGWGYQSDHYFTVKTLDGRTACVREGDDIPYDTPVGAVGYLIDQPRVKGGNVTKPVFRPDRPLSTEPF